MLRTILGLPPSDGRRIVPITVPTETRLEPDWDDSLAVMLEKQPDVVRARAIMKQAEDGSARLARQRALFQQVVHETTHSLARFFLEIEANYKQFRAASNRRAAAAQRREAERASYEERRGTVEHYLDAASQYASAVALEAQYKTVYNIAIVALDEAKGTLLEYEQISIAEGPKPAASTGAVRDGAVKPASREAPAPIASASAAVPPASASLRPPAPVPAAIQPASRLDPSAPQAKDTSAKAGLGGKTYSFQVTIGIGSKPIEIRGSFTITPIQSGYAPKVD